VKQTAAQGLEAALLGWAWRAAASRDPDAASDLGASLGRFFGPRTRKHRHVVANLRAAFPDWPPHRVEAVARDAWAGAGRTLLEYPALGRIGDPAAGRVRVVDLGGLAAVRGTGRPGVFVAGHLGNWNLLPVAAARAGVPLSVVYRRLRNPAVERLMAGWRAGLGCRFLEVEGAARPLLRELQAGRSVGLLMDQRHDRGEKVPFFGLPAPTTLVPARLALRLGLPLIPARVQRLEGARFVVTVHRPVRPEPGLDEDAAARRMTEAVNGLFARWITAAPDQWLCAKRRWPRRKPRRTPRRGTVLLA
jgi:KDO2-lipid IV(A) lauroyltransferase